MEPAPPPADRRARRSRRALMRAAVALVGERGTTNVPVSDLAEAADVSRQLVYQQFGDRDTLLLQAALDLATTELVLRVTTDETLSDRERMLAVARHFAEHRSFYRAMLTGACGYALNKALTGLFGPYNEPMVRRMAGPDLPGDLVETLTLFVTGGSAAVINTWVVDGPDPLDPEAFTDRLLRLAPIVQDSR